MDVLTRLSRSAIVTVVVLDDAKGAVSTAHARLDGGIDAMEIAFRTAASADAIAAIAAQCPDNSTITQTSHP